MVWKCECHYSLPTSEPLTVGTKDAELNSTHISEPSHPPMTRWGKASGPASANECEQTTQRVGSNSVCTRVESKICKSLEGDYCQLAVRKAPLILTMIRINT
jgi:hypothetical protein